MSECKNCGASLTGKFCHACGQSSHSIVKFFGEVFLDFFNDTLGYDSRLKHTLLPILFFPGKLTNDFIKGRRFYYVLPFRLYLITSVFLFLFVQMSFNAEGFGLGRNVDTETINNNDVQVESDIEAGIGESTTNRRPPLLGERPFQNIDDPLVEGSFKKIFVDQIEENWSDWQNDPSPLINQFFKLLPFMMLFVLPVYALFFKLCYFFKKRFYIEHMVFLLHIQSFTYLVIMLAMGIYYLIQTLSGYEFWLTSSISYLLDLGTKAITIWFFIYIFLAMKVVYKQSWLMTFFKYCICSFFYSTILSIGFFLTMIISIGRA